MVITSTGTFECNICWIEDELSDKNSRNLQYISTMGKALIN